uniref:Uncharacterized protein n=1 Tax=Daphnia galeata TaxID=27404 RepID=A0A8J2RKK0_9CRUS|nr:unnamed protein product [Daphnia galeata]
MDEQVEEKVTSFCDEEDDDDDKDSAAAGDGGLLSEIENALGMGFGTLGTNETLFYFHWAWRWKGLLLLAGGVVVVVLFCDAATPWLVSVSCRLPAAQLVLYSFPAPID